MNRRTLRYAPLSALLVAIAACDTPPPSEETETTPEAVDPALPYERSSAEPDAAAEPPGPRWQTAASGEGDALFLASPDGPRRLTFFCPSGSGDLVVNVPSFRAVGSEERMTFGAGGTAVTLVADFRGDPGRGGVTGSGPIPDELPSILSGPEGVGVNYGAQDSGPHAPPPPELARSFVAACTN